MKPFLVLGTYHPPKWDPKRIGKDLTDLTRHYKLKPHVDPAHGAQAWAPWVDLSLHAEVKRRTTKAKAGEDWHQDGDTTPGAKMDCAIVLWSSNTPTEFKTESGEIYAPEPRQVVIFRNLGCHHRRPLNAPRVRWTFRQRVAVPTHLEVP